MAIRNYVGARYVPKLADPVEWQANTSYEAMVIVTYNNASYTSKVPVSPTVGNPAENSNYWALTGNYNAQVEEYRQETADIKTNLTSHINNKENPHSVTKAQVGLGNVDNVSKANILQSVYPVGSIYISTTSTSPAELFGGTWEQIKDRFLLAAGDSYAAGSTGGEKEHKLTPKELPGGVVINRHPTKHITVQGVKRTAVSVDTNEWVFASNQDFDAAEGVKLSDDPHNNMPPYLAVYTWKRIA